MKLMNYQPRQNELLPEWNSFFNDSFGLFAPFFRDANRHLNSSAYSSSVCSVEWFENDENFFALVEVPGLTKKDLRVEAEEGAIRLIAKTSDAGDEKENRAMRITNGCCEFRRVSISTKLVPNSVMES